MLQPRERAAASSLRLISATSPTSSCSYFADDSQPHRLRAAIFLLRSSVPEQRLRIVADYEQRELHEQLRRHRASSAAASSLPTTTAEQTSLLLLIAYDYRWARICARDYYRVRRRHSCYRRLAKHYFFVLLLAGLQRTLARIVLASFVNTAHNLRVTLADLTHFGRARLQP